MHRPYAFNYRVGIFGVLYIENEITNLGGLDQITAPEWVRGNIARIGGDLNNMTIFENLTNPLRHLSINRQVAISVVDMFGWQRNNGRN